MKKILIAATLAAAAFAASAQVTVYGKINATLDNTRTGTATAVTGLVNESSRFGVRVTEDLGNGLSARAVIETAVASDEPTLGAATQLGGRQSTVGLANRFGSVDLGRTTHSQYNAVAGTDVFGTLYGSVAGDVANLRSFRIGNAAFVSLAPIAGVTATLNRGTAELGTAVTAYSLGTTVGPVAVSAARWEQGADSSTVLTAKAKFNNTTVSYINSHDQGADNKRGNLVGVAQKFGAVTAKVSYGETNTAVKAYAVGGEYTLSKRTDVIVAYRKVDAALAAGDVRQFGAGITHRF